MVLRLRYLTLRGCCVLALVLCVEGSSRPLWALAGGGAVAAFLVGRRNRWRPTSDRSSKGNAAVWVALVTMFAAIYANVEYSWRLPIFEVFAPASALGVGATTSWLINSFAHGEQPGT